MYTKSDIISYILVIDSLSQCVKTKQLLSDEGYKVLQATSIAKARRLMQDYSVNVLIVSLELEDVDSIDFIRTLKEAETNSLAIIAVAEQHNDINLQAAMLAGASDFMLRPISKNILSAQITAIEQLLVTHRIYGETIEEQRVAKKIFDSAIKEKNSHVPGMKVYSQSVDIFNGDMALTGKHPDGDTYVLFADHAGHGLTAAIAVLPVSETFFNLLEKGIDETSLVLQINNKLRNLLPTGMFMACCLLKINTVQQKISVLNAGMPDVYLLDQFTGRIDRRFTSSCIPLGITEIESVDAGFEHHDYHKGNQIYMMSDGIIDIVNARGDMFGEERFENLLDEHIGDRELFEIIVGKVNDFNRSCEQKDDMTLVSIPFGELV